MIPGRRVRNLAAILFAALLGFVPRIATADAGPRVLLRERFVDNANGWVERDDDTARVAVMNGSYSLEYKRGRGFWISTQPTDLSEDDDFEIDAVVDRVGGSADQEYGIIWGGRLEAPLSFYFLLLSPNGTYLYGSRRGDQVTFVVKQAPAPQIRPNDGRNRLTLRRRRLVTDLSINGTSISAVLSEPLFGGDVGFFVSHQGAVSVLSFDVSATPPLQAPAAPPVDERCGPERSGAHALEMARTYCLKAEEALGRAGVPTAERAEKAAEYARKAREFDPLFAPAYVVGARAAQEGCDLRAKGSDREGIRKKALPLIKRALELDPGSARAHRVHGELLLALREFGAANVALARSLQLAPASWSSYLSLGLYYQLTGRPDAAEKCWSSGLAVADTPEATAKLLERGGLQFLRDEQPERAAEMLVGSVALAPDSPEALVDLGDLHAAAGRYDEAVESYRKSLSLVASEATRHRLALAYGNRAKKWEDEGRRAEALEGYRKAVECDGRVGWLQLRLGQACERQGFADEAIIAYEKARALDPESFEVGRGLGSAYAAKALGLTGRAAAMHRAVAVLEYQTTLKLTTDPAQLRELERAIEEVKRLGIDW